MACGQDAEARSGAPVDGYGEVKSLVLLIAAHVPELGPRLQRVDELRRPAC